MHNYTSDNIFVCDICGAFLTEKAGILRHMKVCSEVFHLALTFESDLSETSHAEKSEDTL